MNLNIIGRKVNLRDNFKTLATKKISKFDKIFDSDAEAVITVTLEKNHQKVEITVKQRGMYYRAEAVSMEMNEALDSAISKLSRQIRKNKTKLEKYKKVSQVLLQDEIIDDEEEKQFELVRVKQFDLSLMTVDEAILQMNLLDHEFFMFLNSETNLISVVYKRKDNNYGLLEPYK